MLETDSPGGAGRTAPHLYEELLDYRRRVAALYAKARQNDLDHIDRSAAFRMGRDQLFQGHPQSPLDEDQRTRFANLCYYTYDPAWRFVLPIDTGVDPTIVEVQLEKDGLVRMERFGKIHFTAGGQQVSLSLFWLLGYGGGLFLPFHDATCGDTTYGGGRYLLDTIKHADLGQEQGGLVIDFNYAYNPSCAYNSRWSCPLAPRENYLPIAIPAGERVYEA